MEDIKYLNVISLLKKSVDKNINKISIKKLKNFITDELSEFVNKHNNFFLKKNINVDRLYVSPFYVCDIFCSHLETNVFKIVVNNNNTNNEDDTTDNSMTQSTIPVLDRNIPEIRQLYSFECAILNDSFRQYVKIVYQNNKQRKRKKPQHYIATENIDNKKEINIVYVTDNNTLTFFEEFRELGTNNNTN